MPIALSSPGVEMRTTIRIRLAVMKGGDNSGRDSRTFESDHYARTLPRTLARFSL